MPESKAAVSAVTNPATQSCATSVLTPVLDAVSAGALTIGPTTATSLVLSQPVTFSGKQKAGASVNLIADPGDAGAIPVTFDGCCAMTSAGAETRTLAAPAFIGQRISLICDVDGGSIVVTVASAVNQTGNNTLTLAEVKDMCVLEAMQVGGVKIWRIVANDGVALSTV